MRNFLQRFKQYNLISPSEITPEMESAEREAYLKYILTFNKPIEDARRIGLNLENLAEFDWVDESSEDNHINGHLEKRFVRLNKFYFAKEFEEIRKNYPNSSYVTYLSDEDIVNDEMPSNVSVLLKEIERVGFLDDEVEKHKMYSEYVTPKILSFFGCKTCCNIVRNVTSEFYIMSLDFIKPEQYYYSSKHLNNQLNLNENTLMMENFASLDEMVDILKYKVNFEFDVKKPNADKQKIKEEYALAYLTRVLVVGDRDFCERNYGFIYDASKNEIFSAPNFDFELGFNRLARNLPSVEQNLKYISREFPEIYGKFIKDLDQFVAVNKVTGKTKYRELVEASVPDENITSQFCRLINENVKFLKANHARLERGSSQSQPE